MKNTLLICLMLVGVLLLKAQAESEGGGAQKTHIVEVDANVIQPGGVFNVLTYNVASNIAIKNTGLKEAGLAAGSVILQSDEIRIFSSREVMDSSPLARIWLAKDADGVTYRFQTGGEGSAEDFVIPKGAVVMVWTRVSTSPVTWSNVFR